LKYGGVPRGQARVGHLIAGNRWSPQSGAVGRVSRIGADCGVVQGRHGTMARPNCLSRVCRGMIGARYGRLRQTGLTTGYGAARWGGVGGGDGVGEGAVPRERVGPGTAFRGRPVGPVRRLWRRSDAVLGVGRSARDGRLLVRRAGLTPDRESDLGRLRTPTASSRPHQGPHFLWETPHLTVS